MFNLLSNTIAYCAMRIKYEECKWWQFNRKALFKEQVDWYYPLMRGEMKTMQKMEEASEVDNNIME